MPPPNLWTRQELIVALNLYLKLPFGKLHARNPQIIELAQLLHRTPGSIAMRLTNFAAVDPYHQQRGISGLRGGKNQVEPIWNEFANNKDELLFESERILAQFENRTLEEKFPDAFVNAADMKGEDKLRLVKTRVNQHVFRQIVLENYSGKCAISGIDIPELLVASHILPWAKSPAERLNPQNGICLSALYDKAYENGYIGIDENCVVVISKALSEKRSQRYYSTWFAPLHNRRLTMPIKYIPDRAFLQYHMDVIFKR